jgi:methylase of polypeptide subunit release factors
MPRLPPSLLRQARVIDPFLPPLLAPCRDLNAAQNELRWLREYADKVAKGDAPKRASVLKKLVGKRAAGTPLQYLLGTEYFGDLEIRCRPGVLIPRYMSLASR